MIIQNCNNGKTTNSAKSLKNMEMKKFEIPKRNIYYFY